MKQPRARLLVFNDPRSMRIDSALAKEIGFEDSIVLLQLEYLIGISQHEHDGRLWTFQSLRNLNKEQFPWWSPATLGRILKRLEKRELIVIGNFNKTEWDKTQWFALNEAGIAQLKSVCLAPDPFQIETPPVSKRNIDVSKMKHRYDQNETTIPKTTPETTQSGGDTRARATPSQDRTPTPPPLDPIKAGLIKAGLTPDQATTAIQLQTFTPIIITALHDWSKKLKARGVNPGKVLHGYTKLGLLPDDLVLPESEEERPPPIEWIYDEASNTMRPSDPVAWARIKAQQNGQTQQRIPH